MKFFDKYTIIDREKIIGNYEILGGVVGVGILLDTLKSGIELFSLGTLFFYFIGISLFVLNIYAGIQLFKHKYIGYKLSIYAQLIQIPYISCWGFSYLFSTGIFFIVGLIGPVQLGFNLNFGSQIEILFFADESPFLFAVNIVPLLLYLYLKKSYLQKTMFPEIIYCPYCKQILNVNKKHLITKQFTYCISCQIVVKLSEIMNNRKE